MAKTKETPKAKPKKAAVSKPKTTAKKKAVITTKKKTSKPEVKPSEIICAFCGNTPKDTRSLLGTQNKIFICDECLEEFNKVLFKQDKEYWGIKLLKLLKEELDNEPVKKKSKKETS
jgi:hypothetical protein